MTREEAIAKGAACELREAGAPTSWANRQIADNFVTLACALGLLKLEEPKDCVDKIWESYHPGCQRIIGMTREDFRKRLDEIGLRIVEK